MCHGNIYRQSLAIRYTACSRRLIFYKKSKQLFPPNYAEPKFGIPKIRSIYCLVDLSKKDKKIKLHFMMIFLVKMAYNYLRTRDFFHKKLFNLFPQQNQYNKIPTIFITTNC